MEKFKAKLQGAWKSFTVWVNGVAAVVLALLPFLQQQLPALQPYLGADIYRNAMLALVVINIALRFKTDRGLESK
jgi:hypothetical protein